MGAQLPPSSPAAENVAALAASTLAGGPNSTALSDYRGVEALEQQPYDVITYRKAMYSGVRLQVRARAPQGFSIAKVKAHVCPDSCTDARERFLALGNEAADQVAKAAALAQQGGPTPGELQEWERQSAFLHRFVRYVPDALALWPQAGPTSNRKSLPKRADALKQGRGLSFRSDVLGVLLTAETSVEQVSASQASLASGGLEDSAQGTFFSLLLWPRGGPSRPGGIASCGGARAPLLALAVRPLDMRPLPYSL